MKNRFWVICLMGMVMEGSGMGKTEGGLILRGLDTLDIPREKGFDFVKQTACTSYFVNTCVLNFDEQFYPPSLKYVIFVQNGYSINKGKMNLDSIKQAPADSLFTGSLYVDSIPPDSLSSRIGNVYLLKTAPDPRPGYNYSLFAKIRIIKFIVIDSAQHQIKMIFLWGYNDSGIRDLTTKGLDTFHLDGTSALPSNLPPTSPANLSSVNKQFFMTTTSKFTLPQSLPGAYTFVTVYDLAGKMLGRAVADKNRVVDLRQFAQGKGVLVIRMSPRP
jgi:hypothetical protein